MATNHPRTQPFPGQPKQKQPPLGPPPSHNPFMDPFSPSRTTPSPSPFHPSPEWQSEFQPGQPPADTSSTSVRVA
ncbi:MAG: hypothetical protein JWM37_93 [Candidatus Saccharibacteria bacterium]|nr:hypothetical protein [Candidatus Saccharibacteria bacterium]